jgi:hypothetical protein
MRALIIDNDIKATIQSCIKYAEENVISEDDLLKMIKGELQPAGDDENRVVRIPVGYRVAFSLEQQPSGRFRRISISVPTTGKVPSVPAAQEIIKEFGYEGEIAGDVPMMVSLEEIGEGRQAIQIVEKINQES